MRSTPDLTGRTILYLVSEDGYFWSHRLPLARGARDAGAQVVVASSMGRFEDRIRDEGFRPVSIPFDRTGLNPLRDQRTVRAILATYRRIRPDLVHHVAAKPVLYGSLAAAIAGVPRVVNAMAGLGFLFIGDSRKRRLLRSVFQAGLKGLGRRSASWAIVQNEDDAALFRSLGFDAGRLVLIPGSGVDPVAFAATPEPAAPPVVATCVSRMLWDKGVGELVEAARLLDERRVPVRIRLVGGTDLNPASIPEETLAEWKAEGVVDVAGPSTDVAGEYARCHIAVLPSYREGLPKSLLEAASCARAMVATDVPGCRAICRHGETGLLVPSKDSAALADAIERLAVDPALRARFGAAGRALVEAELAQDQIVSHTLSLYDSVLRRTAAAAA